MSVNDVEGIERGYPWFISSYCSGVGIKGLGEFTEDLNLHSHLRGVI